MEFDKEEDELLLLPVSLAANGEARVKSSRFALLGGGVVGVSSGSACVVWQLPCSSKFLVSSSKQNHDVASFNTL